MFAFPRRLFSNHLSQKIATKIIFARFRFLQWMD